MPMSWALLAAMLLATAGFYIGRSRAYSAGGSDVRNLHSRPTYHGFSVALSVVLPALIVLVLASGLRMSGVIPAGSNAVAGLLALGASVAGLGWAMTRIDGSFRARNSVERMVLGLMIFCSMIAIATTLGIILSLIFETIRST